MSRVAMRLLVLVCVVVVAVCVQAVSAFNYFDLQVPLVVDSGLTAAEARDRGFGFSLTQHRFQSDNSTVALVGAPRADGDVLTRVGGVYSCPLVDGGSCDFAPSFQNITKSRLPAGFDPTNITALMELANSGVSVTELFSSVVTTRNVSLSGQLLGYSLRSFGDRVAACAPLYIHQFLAVGSGEVPGAGGRCVLLNNDFSEVEYQVSPERLTGLRLGGLDSGLINVNGNDFVAISSPFSGATNTPRGQVSATFVGLDNGETFISPSDSAAFLPLTGYHLEHGYFTQSIVAGLTEQLVSSAPRSNKHFGSVEIYTLAGTLLRLDHIIDGTEADGYFGYDFAVLDLLSGGYHSLVVGCPLCSRDSGQIYVYAHTGDPTSPFGSPMVIPSPSLAAGRFGLSVENIGDIDLDGFQDVAVSAPYEGSGVVYIYRGKSSGLVADDFQMVPALPMSEVFGFTVSGGLDIDGNSYPDFTVGGMGGDSHLISSFLASPLINVTVEFEDKTTMLDLSERLCEVMAGVRLSCFNVTSCFYFEAAHGADISQFALTFDLEVDAAKSRVGSYDAASGTLGGGVVTRELTLSSPGPAGRSCQTFTFALKSGFTDTVPIPVRVSVGDAASPLPLDPATPSSSLHPKLLRYSSGEQLAATNQDQYEVQFNLNCGGERDPNRCEPRYNLDIQEDFPFAVDGQLVLAEGNEFGYTVTLNNSAADDGINPMLNIMLPSGVELSRYSSLSLSSLTECSSQEQVVTCTLQNPILSGAILEFEIFFKFNLSRISLDSSELLIRFFAIDGFNDLVTANVSLALRLDAVASFAVNTFASQTEYQAFRLSTFRNHSFVPLNATGPVINIQVLLENALGSTTGTPVPLSTLYIHFPVETRLGSEGSRVPLIVPTELIVGSVDANCSHVDAIPEGLSSLQQPLNFVPPMPPPGSAAATPPPGCEEEFRCGLVVCTVRDLSPSSPVPGQITLFARLFSPNVLSQSDITVYASLVANSDLPRLDENSNGSSQVMFQLRPAVTEVQRDCILYWIVVVSVVAGIGVLVGIIVVLALCGLFRTWYKAKREEATYDVNGYDQPDSDFTYRQRTLPPIAGLTNGRESTPQLTSFQPTSVTTQIKPEPVAKETEADAEAAKELEHQLSPPEFDTSTPITVAPPEGVVLERIEYDPHEGVSGEGEGMETDL